jgi:hypothetical protein
MLEKCSVTVDDISNLLIYLPGKDFSIGSRFLGERKFEELLELVESCIKLYKRSSTYREKYPNFNMEKMMEFRSVIQEYCRFLYIEDRLEEEEDFETLEKIEEYDEEFCYFILASR